MGLLRQEETIENEVKWLGWPVYAKEYQGIDPGFYAGGAPPAQFCEEGVEIGLRPDGIVIWRLKSSEKKHD